MAFPPFEETSPALVKRYLTPDIYTRLSRLETPAGFTLDQAIRSGLENPDSSIGIYAGDAQAYALFRDIFEPVIREYHGMDRKLDHGRVGEFRAEALTGLANPDPDGEFIRSSRVRVARNLSGFAFPPHISAGDRKAVETKALEAMETLPRELKGEYYSMTGLSPDEIRERAAKGRAFIPGDRFMASAGVNRMFPEARGVYRSRDGCFMTWINEEDHLRVISLEQSSDLIGVFMRLGHALKALSRVLSFSVTPSLGCLSSCPTNIGTAMRAGVHICLPRLEKQPGLMAEIVRDHVLQIRGTRGEKTKVSGAVFDISNRRRLGLSETTLFKGLHAGVTALIRTEKTL